MQGPTIHNTMHNSKFANRDDGQDGSLHDFVIEFDMFHTKSFYTSHPYQSTLSKILDSSIIELEMHAILLKSSYKLEVSSINI